ncbi:MAG: pyridoxal phosphate-dependent aminotransferase [Planctomycetes bacterium]|nr:pyridoxal phosphate-dependent aminotransferase [Planctomycetota bacterium]
MQLSTAVQRIQPSATIAAAAQAKALKATGVTVYEFTLGEPDFPTPPPICDAAKAAMDSGQTHYTPPAGIPELKAAICDAARRDHGLAYTPAQVVVSNGAKHSLHNVLTALCGPGDEVIIPAPYWVSYSALVELTGAKPVIVPTREEDGFCLSAEQLQAAITPNTRLLMLNNPCNPTGAAYPLSTLEALAGVIVENDLLVVSDEIYEKLIYEGSEFRSFASFGSQVAERTILVTGVSKAYAMTGWRIGWTLTGEELTKAMTKLQSQETSNPCSISQHAAIAALNGPQECVQTMCAEFAKRRSYVLERMRGVPDISFADPGGAFYLFFNVSQYFNRSASGGDKIENSSDFCAALLKTAHVAMVTGDAFGAPGYVRLSFATSLDVLAAGLDRLEQFLKELA